MTTPTQRRSILVVSVHVDPADAEELNRWYDEEQPPERLAMPGFISLRRFRAHDDPNRFLALYELDYPEAATSPEYMSQKPSPWMTEVMAKWKQWDRNVWVELVSGER